MTPTAAAQIHGKIGYVLIAAWGRIGRAGGQPLVQRATRDTPPHRWTPGLEHSFKFFEALFSNLPHLEIPLVREHRPPVVVYTDASFDIVESLKSAVLGFVIVDPVTGMMMHAWVELPQSYYRFFAEGKKTYIMQAELVAAIGAYFSVPMTLKGRPILHFIDNTGGFSALVNGYASKEDCTRFVNMFHIQLLGLRSKVYFDWVPSLANMGDWPTRADKRHLIPRQSHKIPFILALTGHDWACHLD